MSAPSLRLENAVVEDLSNPKQLSETMSDISSPISALPIETLCHIFLMAQDMSRVNSGKPQNPLLEVVVSQVCQLWRTTAVSLPNLWTCFRYKYSLERNMPHDRLAAYLERSNPLLLDLSIDLGFIALSFPKSHPHLSLLWSVIPHVNRWRHITFMSPESSSLAKLHERLRPLEAPHLESFTICPYKDPVEMDFGENDKVVNNLDPRIFLGGAPKLSHARFDSPLFIPPLSVITILRLEQNNLQRYDWLSWSAFLQIFEQLPLLTSLSICEMVVVEPGLDDDLYRLIKADKLKHLRIGHGKIFSLYLLLRLSAPVLERLDLHNMPSVDEQTAISDSTELPIFPMLRVFGIHDVAIATSDEVDFMITIAPNVKYLIILRDPGDGDMLIDRLCKTSSWPQLCEFGSNGLKMSSIKPYVDFAFARKQMGAPLHTIRVDSECINSWKKSKTLKRLENCCEIEPLTTEFNFNAWPPEW